MPLLYGGQISLGIRAYFYSEGALVDPDFVSYSIFDPSGTPIQGHLDHQAVREDLGDYRADWAPPAHQVPGLYRITWDFRLLPADTLRSSTDEFRIVQDLSEESKAPHIPTGAGMGVVSKNRGAGNSSDLSGFVIRDFWGRVRVFNI